MMKQTVAEAKPVTDQEEMLGKISRYSVGGRSVFLTRTLSEDSIHWQPADLIWTSGKCILLIYTTRQKKAGQSHNLREADRWLSKWSSGKDIQAVRPLGDKSISFVDYPFKIILSVVRKKSCPPTIHTQFVTDHKEFGVVMCITVPESMLNIFSEYGGSMFDLLQILVQFCRAPPSPDERQPTAVQTVRDYFESRLRMYEVSVPGFSEAYKNHHIALARGLPARIQPRTALHRAVGYMMDLRSSLPSNAVNLLMQTENPEIREFASAASDDVCAFLNDQPFDELLRCTIAILAFLRDPARIRVDKSVPNLNIIQLPGSAVIAVWLANYITSEKSPENQEKVHAEIVETMNKLSAFGDGEGVCLIMLEPELGGSSAMLRPFMTHPYKTRMETLLEEIIAETSSKEAPPPPGQSSSDFPPCLRPA